MNDSSKELDRIIRPTDPHKTAFIKALSNIKLIEEIPDNDADIQKWEEENPDKALQLENAIDHITSEFRLSISSEPDKDLTEPKDTD